RSGDGRWSGRAASLARFLGGMALVLGVLFGSLAAAGVLPLADLYRDVVQDSLGFVDFGKAWPLLGSEVGVFLGAGLGLALACRVRGRAIFPHPVHSVLLLPALSTTAVLLLPRTPAVYQHAWLPVLPVVAVYAGLSLATLAEWARQRAARWRQGLALV